MRFLKVYNSSGRQPQTLDETMISSTSSSPGQSSVRCRHMQLTAQRSAAARAGPRACMHVGLRTEPAGGWQCSIFSRQAMAAAAVALLLRIPAVVTASATLVFSPPAVVSAPVPCATAAGVGCGSVRSTVEREDVAADNRKTHECQMQRRVKHSFANACGA